MSNLDADDMVELAGVPDGGDCATNQVLYNPARAASNGTCCPGAASADPADGLQPDRAGPAADEAAPWARSRKQPRLSPFQVALAWVLAQPGVIAIPKAGEPEHVDANVRPRARVDCRRAGRDRREFPPPRRKQPLAML